MAAENRSREREKKIESGRGCDDLKLPLLPVCVKEWKDPITTVTAILQSPTKKHCHDNHGSHLQRDELMVMSEKTFLWF